MNKTKLTDRDIMTLEEIVEEFGLIELKDVLNSDAIYILKNGSILDTKGKYSQHQHINIADYISKETGEDDFEYDGSKFLNEENAIRFTTWIPAFYLPKKKLTGPQKSTLFNVLLKIRNKVSEETPLMISTLKGTQQIEINEINGYKDVNNILFRIENYYRNRILESMNNQSNIVTEEQLLDAIEKMSDRDDISYNNTFAVEENAPAILVARNGDVIDVDAYEIHSDFLETVFQNNFERLVDEDGFYIDWDDAYRYTTQELGWMTLNTGDGFSDYRCKIVYDCKQSPTSEQYKVLERWLNQRFKENKKDIIVFWKNDDKEFNLQDYDTNSFIKMLKKSFLTGILGESKELKEAKFGTGITGQELEKFVDDYIKEHEDELVQEIIDYLNQEIEYISDDEKELLQRLKDYLNDNSPLYPDYNVNRLIYDYIGYDDLEDRTIESLQDKFYKAYEEVYKYVTDSIKDDDDITFKENISHSFARGNFPSHYITLTIWSEDREDYEEKTIRFCDGHDNGREASDLEINFLDWIGYRQDRVKEDIDELIEELREERDWFN